MNLRRASLVIAGVLLGAAAPVTAAQASSASSHPAQATRFAAQATSYQNATIARALSHSSSGTRIGPGMVEWHNGSVRMIVPQTPDTGSDNCPDLIITDTWTCVYNKKNFKGTQLQFKDAGKYQDLFSYVSNWVTRSWDNELAGRAWLNEFKTSNHGASECMSGHFTTDANYDGAARTDGWILLTTNDNNC